MFPPPSPDIIKQLVGRCIELIAFGKYVVHVSLGNADRLSIACPFRFGVREAESPLSEFPLGETNMLRVIGSYIDQAECDADGTLRLGLASGDTLVAYANDPGYEAYTLSLGGTEYVV